MRHLMSAIGYSTTNTDPLLKYLLMGAIVFYCAAPCRFRARGLSAPAVHTATPTSRASGSASGSGSGVLNWAGDQLVVAPQGCWLHSALGHLDEGETRRPTPSQSADDKESHTLRTVRRGDGGNTSWTYVLSGTTSVGTLHAVYSFAEDVLGVRFYPHGDVVPSSSADASASLPDIGHRHYAAQFDVRGVRSHRVHLAAHPCTTPPAFLHRRDRVCHWVGA